MWLPILYFLSSYKPINLLYLRNSNFNFFFLHVFLWQVTRVVTANLNKIIDINYYPVETAKRSNLQNRPIGIGVQGLADTFILLGMAFDSPEVKLKSVILILVTLRCSARLSMVACIAGPTIEQRHIWNHILPCTESFFWVGFKRWPLWDVPWESSEQGMCCLVYYINNVFVQFCPNTFPHSMEMKEAGWGMGIWLLPNHFT